MTQPSVPPSSGRPLVVLFAVVTTALALSACGAGDGTGGGDAGAAGFPTSAEGELRLYNWTDYISPDLIDRFEEETGITVVLDTYDSNETLLARLQAGGEGYDVIVPSDYMVDQMIDLELLQPIDATEFPNGDNIDESFVDVYFDPGRRYTAPYLYGLTGIAYLPEAAGTEITSWADFFAADSPAAGDIGTLNDQYEVVHAALRAVGAEPCSEDPADYETAQELLVAWKPGVEVVNSDNVIARMASGEQSVHMMWNGAFYRAATDNPELEFVFPEEGMTLWQDNFAVPVGAPNVDAAKVFIDWMMDPENIAEASNFNGYGNGVAGSVEFLEPDIADNPAINLSPENAERVAPVPPCSLAAIDFYDQVWTEFRS
jgi:spermidine/putrescine transport system substrate-binding protein